MDTTFFSPSDVKAFIENNSVRDEITSGSTIGICSVGDALHALEDNKKRLNPLSIDQLEDRIEQISECSIVCISNLDREKLFANLFDKDENDIVTGICQDSARSHVHPRRSIRILSLRICNHSTWWTERVEEEMDQYHQEP